MLRAEEPAGAPGVDRSDAVTVCVTTVRTGDRLPGFAALQEFRAACAAPEPAAGAPRGADS